MVYYYGWVLATTFICKELVSLRVLLFEECCTNKLSLSSL